MPFHSVRTEDEADELIVTHCVLGKIEGRPEFMVRRDWPPGDILAAMASAARQFGLEPEPRVGAAADHGRYAPTGKSV